MTTLIISRTSGLAISSRGKGMARLAQSGRMRAAALFLSTTRLSVLMTRMPSVIAAMMVLLFERS